MKQKLRKTLSLLLIFILVGVCGCNQPNVANVITEQARFDEYLDELFAEMASTDTLTLNYTIKDPTLYDITVPAPTLGNYSIKSIQDNFHRESEYLKRLPTFRYDYLSKEQQLSYDIIKDTFELELKYADYLLYDEVLGPTTGLHAQLPILLAEYKFNSVKDIDDYLELLKDLPRYFKQVCRFEQQKSKAGLFMSNGVAYDVVEQCNSFIQDPDNNFLITYFNEKLLSLTFLTPPQKTEYIATNEKYIKEYVIPAYQTLSENLESLIDTGTNKGGLCYYKHGKEYYQYLVSHETGSHRSMPELVALIENGLTSSMIDIATRVQIDPSVIEKVDSYQYIETQPEKILPYLKSQIAKDFPALPDVNCSIKYVHKSLQDYLSPAMYLIPQIDNYKDNSIYINNKPENDLSEIFTTIAHEGYPGHLYQNVYFRSKNIHPIRNMLTCLGYEEGWATYAEAYSYSIAGLDPSVAIILKDNLIATLCIYSRADIGIHYEDWDYTMTENYISKYFSQDACPVIYDTLLKEPALYLPYCVGYLEIEDLKNTAQTLLGDDFELKSFHEFLLDIGPANFKIIEHHLNEWVQNKKNLSIPN